MSDAMYDQGEGISMGTPISCSTCKFGQGGAGTDMAPGLNTCTNNNCPAFDRWVPPGFYCSMWETQP